MSKDIPQILIVENPTPEDLETYRNEGWRISQELLADKKWIANIPEGGMREKMKYVINILWKTGNYKETGVPHFLFYNVMHYLQYCGVNMELPNLELADDKELIKRDRKLRENLGL